MGEDPSLLDSLLKQAEVAAEQLKANRSRLESQALRQHLSRRDADKLTQALNEIYPAEPSRLGTAWRRLQARSTMGFGGVLSLFRFAYRALTAKYASGSDGMAARQDDGTDSVNSNRVPVVNAVQQGHIWWVDLPESQKREAVLVIQSNPFNRSQMQSVVCLALDSNWRLAQAPGNLLLSQADTGLPHPCVANVAHLVTVDKCFFDEYVSTVPPFVFEGVLDGVQLLLGR